MTFKKTFQEVGIMEGQHNEGHIWQTTANIVLNGEKLKTLPLRSEQDKDIQSHLFCST